MPAILALIFLLGGILIGGASTLILVPQFGGIAGLFQFRLIEVFNLAVIAFIAYFINMHVQRSLGKSAKQRELLLDFADKLLQTIEHVYIANDAYIKAPDPQLRSPVHRGLTEASNLLKEVFESKYLKNAPEIKNLNLRKAYDNLRNVLTEPLQRDAYAYTLTDIRTIRNNYAILIRKIYNLKMIIAFDSNI